MEWREAATEKLKEIGEKVASDVEAALDETDIAVTPPTVIDLTDEEASI